MKNEPDFTQPIGSDFVVALKARNGEFCLYVEAFIRKNGKSYLKHTTKLADAKRFAKFTAQDVLDQVREYRCTGRVERVNADNTWHEPVEPQPMLVR